jgi:beta-glucanase (GH16 family)
MIVSPIRPRNYKGNMKITATRHTRKALGALAILTLVGTSVATTQPAAHAAAPTGYELSWSDEFDGSNLDTSKWGYAYGCFDPALKTQTHYTDSPENVRVADGNLYITALYSPTREKWNKETRKMETIDRTCTRTENGKKVEYAAPFTSAMVQTKDDNGVKYSIKGDFYAEARIKLPENAPSSWSSFWTTGEKGGPWPGNGEIDVFESKGWDASYLQANTHTPRPGNPSKSEQHHGQLANDGTTQTQFHTYGVEKTGDKITFYLDGVPSHVVNYKDIKGTNPFLDEDNGMILRLNQMVGGSFLASDTGDTTYVDAIPYKDAYTGAGASMIVDYVRVYKKAASSDPAPVIPAPTPEPTADPTTEPALPTDPKPVDPTPADPAPVEPTPTPSAPAEPETPATPPADNTATPAPAPTEQPTPEAPTPAPTVETPAPSETAPTVEQAPPANPTEGATPGTDGVHGAGPSTSTPGTNGTVTGGALPAGTPPTATTRGGDGTLAKTGADTNVLVGSLASVTAGGILLAMRRRKARQYARS